MVDGTEKSHSHLPLVCTSTSPVFPEWMSVVWEDPYSHRNRADQETLIDLCHRSPRCSERSLSRRMYMHLGLFTSIPPAGWQARLTAGDATSLSGNPPPPSATTLPRSKTVGGKGWRRERHVAYAKDDRESNKKNPNTTSASIYHSPALQCS